MATIDESKVVQAWETAYLAAKNIENMSAEVDEQTYYDLLEIKDILAKALGESAQEGAGYGTYEESERVSA